MEKLLQELFRAEGGPSPAAGGCPDELQLGAYADGTLQGEARSILETHLTGCESCRDQVAFLVRSEVEEESPVPAALLERTQKLVPAPARSPLAGRWRWAMATAVAALLLAVVLIRDRTPEPLPTPPAPVQAPAVETPSLPQTQPSAPPAGASKALRTVAPKAAGLRVILPKEGARLSVRQLEFRWTEVPGRVFYEVQVTTPEGTPVWQGRTELTSIRAPEERFPAAGGKYFLWVRAHLPSGKTVVSDVVSFESASP